MMATTTQAATVASHPFFDFNDAADLIPPRHDKDEIRSRLLDQLESVLLYLFPRGKRRGSQFYIGNLQGAPGDSLVIGPQVVHGCECIEAGELIDTFTPRRDDFL